MPPAPADARNLQEDRIARLRDLCEGEALDISLANTPTATARPAGIAALYRKNLDADFLEKDTLGEAMAARAQRLHAAAASSRALADRMMTTLDLLAGIDSQQAQASAKTRSLHGTCEQLLKEQMDLASEVELLSKPLEYFDSLESLAAQLGMPLSLRENAKSGKGSEQAGSNSRNARVGASQLHPGSEEFLAALNRIDGCVSFLSAHSEYREAQRYSERYMQLRDRAIALVKNQVVEYLDQAAKTAAEQPVTAGRLELSAVYSRFRAISARVHELVGIIRERASSGSARLLLEECEQCYLEKRLGLLRPPVRQHLEGLSKVRELVACVRFGASYLIRLGQLEARLYDSCIGHSASQTLQLTEENANFNNNKNSSGSGGFSERKRSDSSVSGVSALSGMQRQLSRGEMGSLGGLSNSGEHLENTGLYDMLLALCEELYTHLRPRVLMGNDMNELCEVVGVVREEIVEEHRGRHGRSQVLRKRSDSSQGGGESESIAIETVLSRLVQDAQERLIHCALKAIRLEIEDFQPKPEQLDYPALLQNSPLTPPAPGTLSEASGAVPPGSPAAAAASAAAAAAMATYDSWYPPLRSALMILSKIYRAVDIVVFEDLAHQAVAATTKSLRDGAAAMRKRSPGSSLNSHLFLIQHLLTLREQLAPFDVVSYAHRSTRLNFHNTRTALRKFVSTGPALFRLDKDNALVRVSVESIPTVDEIQVDAKRDMEDTLKAACSSFITEAADMIRDPLVAFLNKSCAFRRAPNSESGAAEASAAEETDLTAGGGAAAQLPRSDLQLLRAQPFAQPERVAELLAFVTDRAIERLKLVTDSMSLYLSPATTAVLVHPIQRRILDAVHEMRALLQDLYSAEEYPTIAPMVNHLNEAILLASPAAVPTPRSLGTARSFTLPEAIRPHTGSLADG